MSALFAAAGEMLLGIWKMLWGFLTSKIAGPIFAAACVGLALNLWFTDMARDRAVDRGDKLLAAIERPVTGWRAQLADCHASKRSLEGGIKSRNDQIERDAKKAKADLALAERQVAAARKDTAVANQRVAKLLASPIKGATVCEQIDDVDRRVLEGLSK